MSASIPRMTLVGIASVALTFCVAGRAVRLFSGICVTIALTRFPASVSRLYAADLVGAAAGCFLLSLSPRSLDGPTAVIVVAALASAGACLFRRRRPGWCGG